MFKMDLQLFAAKDIMLGEGTFSVGASLGAMTEIAVVRGGGRFTLEREQRIVQADGDYGPVKGRIRTVGEIAKLTVNALELLPAHMPKFYPGMDLETSDPGKDVLTSTLDIVTGDYNFVTFTGSTIDGKQVYIELQNAINLENLDWGLVDKDEVIAALTYTAAYDEAARTTPPWKVEFAKGTTYTVTLTIETALGAAIVGASVAFNNSIVLSAAVTGNAVFTGVPVGNNIPFSVTAGGYATYFGAVNVVSADVTQTVALTALP